jgi:hypothetical protein
MSLYKFGGVMLHEPPVGGSQSSSRTFPHAVHFA